MAKPQYVMNQLELEFDSTDFSPAPPETPIGSSIGNCPARVKKARLRASGKKSQGGNSEIIEVTHGGGIPYWIKNMNGWTAWWWRSLHSRCLGCQRNCKQSAKVKIVYCPQFLEIESASRSQSAD